MRADDTTLQRSVNSPLLVASVSLRVIIIIAIKTNGACCPPPPRRNKDVTAAATIENYDMTEHVQLKVIVE